MELISFFMYPLFLLLTLLTSGLRLEVYNDAPTKPGIFVFLENREETVKVTGVKVNLRQDQNINTHAVHACSGPT
jgi:hypothetical protein